MTVTVEIELSDEQSFVLKNLADEFNTVTPWGDDTSAELEDLGLVSLDLERGQGWLTDLGRQVRAKLREG